MCAIQHVGPEVGENRLHMTKNAVHLRTHAPLLLRPSTGEKVNLFVVCSAVVCVCVWPVDLLTKQATYE